MLFAISSPGDFMAIQRTQAKKIQVAQRDKVRADVGVESCAEVGSKLLVD